MNAIVNKATEHGPYTYNYDSLYRLVTADGGPLTAERYSYDPIGNRLTSSNAGNWSYNQNNELQSYNGVSFQYDLNGNTTQKNDNGAIQNFLYNEDDRLTEVKDGSSSVIATYYYDPFGRRLLKEVGGARTYFMYADEGLIAEFDGTGSQTTSFGYAPNSTWTTNPLYMKQGSEYYFYHNDHLGTPQRMTSVNGSVVWSAKYESFGKAVVDPAATIENNLRFPGQYYDQETGLHNNYNRYYDPRTGRYLTPDSKGLEAGINLFTYVENNPSNDVDPMGLMSESEIRNLIEANNQSNLSTELILCIIYKESTFNPNAKRNDGGSAKGFMGVIDPSAEWVGYKSSDMLKPEENIRAGTKLLNRFVTWKAFGNGDVAKGLGIYGTGNRETPIYSKQILDCEKCLKTKRSEECDNHDDCYKPLHGGR